jgi:hypothetical protein
VFSLGPALYRVSDVVRAAGLRGDLAALVETVRQGIACVKQAAEADTMPTDAEIEAAGSEFRYDRDLISADEMHAWLERWGLSIEDWTGYLERHLLRRRWEEGLPDLVARYPASDDEVAEHLHVEGICSGEYGRLAHELATRLAAYGRARDEGWVTAAAGDAAHLPDQEALAEAVERLRAHAVTPAAVHAEITARHLDWIRLDCEFAAFADLHRAREAILCVREDGRELARVAEDAGSVVERETLCLEEMEPAWRDSLLGAREGAIVGPLGQGGAFVVLRVHAKTLPVEGDPDIRRRAETKLLDSALEQEIANRVKWHQRL